MFLNPSIYSPTIIRCHILILTFTTISSLKVDFAEICAIGVNINVSLVQFSYLSEMLH